MTYQLLTHTPKIENEIESGVEESTKLISENNHEAAEKVYEYCQYSVPHSVTVGRISSQFLSSKVIYLLSEHIINTLRHFEQINL